MQIPSDPEDPRIQIIRSARRKRTVSAQLRDGGVVVRMPQGLSHAAERDHIAQLLPQLQRRYGGTDTRASDEFLRRRARELAARWLDTPGETAVWERLKQIRWVPPMRTRWASCTPSTGTIRISSTLQGAPGYVLDYVLVHELVHLRVYGHDAEFWRRVRAFPHTDRALGFLQAWSLLRHGGKADDEALPPEMAAASPEGEPEPDDVLEP